MNIEANFIRKCKRVINEAELVKVNGKVTDVVGLIIISVGPNVSLGEVCFIVDTDGNEVCKAEVVGFKDGKVLSIALGEVHRISPSCEIIASGKNFTIGVGEQLIGRVI